MRDSTTLLRSQCDALRNLDPEQFYLAVTALWDYEMDGTEPSDPVAAMAVGMAKPIIDKRAKRAAAGAIGGSKRKQTEENSKQTEANEKQTEANDPYKDKSKKIKEENKKIKDIDNRRFAPPTLEDVRGYIQEQGYSIDANRFIDFYSSKGWMVGKNKMKDWRAAVRGWASRDKPKKTGFNNFSDSGADWDDLAYQVMQTQ